MSIDKIRSKKDINEEIKERKREQHDRLINLEKTVNDKKLESLTARKLLLSGTSEGSRDVQKAINAASDSTTQEFKQKEQVINKEVFNKAKELEHELNERSSAVKKDINQLEGAVSKIHSKEVGGKLREAVDTQKKDQNFLESSETEQTRIRSDGEHKLDEQKKDLNGTSISFKSGK